MPEFGLRLPVRRVEALRHQHERGENGQDDEGGTTQIGELEAGSRSFMLPLTGVDQ
ncbi:hypothetical protein NQK81_04300 [Amycolatopsis roodepoortensis]|uniref:hypothetical protein n=1 Tax=Amycolatopsis roodepoortensis TaxID=700274 RepID=UPI00214A90B8|nr:hypothetical protein [Amycolatopsis roodepoortensis]UUV32684.1 hypothetical protein NQK81_04300 [Amycolatopsis roodepoortensis]